MKWEGNRESSNVEDRRDDGGGSGGGGGLGGNTLSLWEPRTYVTFADGSGFWAAIQNVPAIDPENPTQLEEDDAACVSAGGTLDACATMPRLAVQAHECILLPELGASDDRAGARRLRDRSDDGACDRDADL